MVRRFESLVCTVILATVASDAVHGSTAGPVGFDAADRVYSEAIRDGIAIEARMAELAADERGSAADRSARLYLASLLAWRHGDLEGALTTAREALRTGGRTGELLRHEGRLLDAAGRRDDAVGAYREAAQLLSGRARRDIELRLALLLVDGNDVQPLSSLAEGSDTAFRNRIAVLLAVLGHPGKAIGTYTPAPDASDDARLRDYLRLTEWALQAGDLSAARETAWRAVRQAGSRQDRLYALALLTEAYRLGDSLAELVAELEAGGALGDEARALWIALLRETERADDALAILEGRGETEPVEVKRQLVGLYRESGRTAEMVAELQRLMVSDSDETVWPQGLAEYHLERGDSAAAAVVWRTFVDGSDAPAALLAGAELMKTQHLDALALDAVGKAQSAPGWREPGAEFRFELHVERGRHVEAGEVLAELERSTAAADPVRKRVAMSYERLGRLQDSLRVMQAFAATDAGNTPAVRQYVADLLIVTGEPGRAVEYLLASLAATTGPDRSLAYARIIAAAREAGSEDALAADLTEKLDSQEASDAEALLLIEMRVRAGETDAALAVVDTLYGPAESLDKLKRRAAVYRSLGDWRAYDSALADLTERDPDNALLHVRSRIINYIENLQSAQDADGSLSLLLTPGGQEPLTLSALLDQYGEVSEAGADREFEAGLLSMAGRPEQAVAVYREVLAVDPSRIDSYLAIGNQLAAVQKDAQAVGMYQYLIESSDDEDLSWAALDGIIGLDPAETTLEWAQRRVLERLAATPDVFAPYRQLADLSADLGEGELQFGALLNGLSAEPALRLPTLRELLRITATTRANRHLGGVIFGGQSLSLNERHVVFGRRLLALGLEMPPDVYVSLGRAMIAAGDSDAALRAVNQAVEHTGHGDLLTAAADIFQQAGDDLSARRLFERAVLNDAGNVGLLLRAAWSSERLQGSDRAAELFLQGLTFLLRTLPTRVEEITASAGFNQPVEVPEEGELDGLLLKEGQEAFPLLANVARTHSRAYQQYYVPFRNGLIRVLAASPERREAVLGELWDDYRSTLSTVRAERRRQPEAGVFPPPPPGLPRLAHYPALRAYAQLLRYLAYAFGDYAAIDEMDRSLLALFPDDPVLPAILVSHRLEWGSVAYLDWLEAATGPTDSQKQRLRELWLAAANRETGLSADPGTSALLSPGHGARKSMLTAAVRAGDVAGMVEGAKQLAETDLLWDALEDVEPYLPASAKAAIAEHVIPIIRGNPEQVANSMRISVGHHDLETRPRPWAAKLADWSGKRVLDERQILEVVRVPDEQQLGDRRLGVVDVWYVYRTLSRDGRREWLEALLKRRLSLESRQAMMLLALLLQVPPEPAADDLLRWMLREHEGYFHSDMFPLDRIDIHPANVPLARELVAIARRKHAKHFAESMPDPVFEPNFLLAEGKTTEALQKLLDIYFDGRLPPRTSMDGVDRDALGFIDSYRSRLIAGNERALIDMLDARKPSSAEQVRESKRLAVHLHRLLPKRRPGQLLSVVLDALETDPGNAELLALAFDLQDRTGRGFAAREFLRKRLDSLTDDGRAWQLDHRRDAVLRQLFERSLELDHPLDAAAYREALGAGPEVAAVAAPVPPMPGDASAIARALREDDRARLELELSRLWQAAVVSERTGRQEPNAAGNVSLTDIAAMSLNEDDLRRFMLDVFRGRQSGTKPEPEAMLKALAEHPLGVATLEAWLTSVRGRMLGQASELVGALADAHVHSGSAAARFAGLTAAIRDRRAGDRELSLWLALGSRRPELAAGDAAASVLNDVLGAEAVLRPSVVLSTARLLSAVGDRDGALKRFESLIDRAHTRGAELPAAGATDLSLGAVLTNASATLDADGYERLLRYTFDTVKPLEAHLLPSYSEFVLNQFDAAADPEAFYRAFGDDLDAALERLGDDRRSGNRTLLLTRVTLTQFAVGRKQAALEAYRLALEVRAEELAALSAFSLGVAIDAAAGADPSPQSAASTIAYRRLLDLDAATVAVERGAMQFLVRPDADLSAQLFRNADRAWLEQAEARVRGWLDAGEMDRGLAVGVLLSLARAYRESGHDDRLQALFAYLEMQLESEDKPMPATAAAIVVAAHELGYELDRPALDMELLRIGAIEPRHMAAAFRRVAAAQGAAAALDIGSALLEYTLEDRLLDEMITLAEAAGQLQRAEEWRALQGRARFAREELERTKAAAEVY